MSNARAEARPVVGLTTSTHPRRGFQCLAAYVAAVRQAGGIPILIPPGEDIDELKTLNERLDGILFTGGPDIDSRRYGEAPHPRTKPMEPLRETWDLALAEAVLTWPDTPVLAICLGMQELGVAAGGRLIQHLPDRDGIEEHRAPDSGERMHPVSVQSDGLLCSIVGPGELQVNTRHHQGLATVGANLQITARTQEGVIEAVEMPGHRFGLGVQWHPERITHLEPHAALFKHFIDACRTA